MPTDPKNSGIGTTSGSLDVSSNKVESMSDPYNVKPLDRVTPELKVLIGVDSYHYSIRQDTGEKYDFMRLLR